MRLIERTMRVGRLIGDLARLFLNGHVLIFGLEPVFEAHTIALSHLLKCQRYIGINKPFFFAYNSFSVVTFRISNNIKYWLFLTRSSIRLSYKHNGQGMSGKPIKPTHFYCPEFNVASNPSTHLGTISVVV